MKILLLKKLDFVEFTIIITSQLFFKCQSPHKLTTKAFKTSKTVINRAVVFEKRARNHINSIQIPLVTATSASSDPHVHKPQNHFLKRRTSMHDFLIYPVENRSDHFKIRCCFSFSITSSTTNTSIRIFFCFKKNLVIEHEQ